MRSSLSALEQYLAEHESEIEEPRQSLGSGYVRNKKTNGVSISFDRDDIVESNAYKATSHGLVDLSQTSATIDTSIVNTDQNSIIKLTNYELTQFIYDLQRAEKLRKHELKRMIALFYADTDLEELNTPIDHDVIITDDGVVEDYLLGVDGLGVGVLGVGDSDNDNGGITHNTDDTTLDDVNILHNNRVYRSNEAGNIFNSIKSEWIGSVGNVAGGDASTDSNDPIPSIKSSKEILAKFNNKSIPPSGLNANKIAVKSNNLKQTGVVGYKKQQKVSE